MMKDSVLILSGGMDSFTLLYDYQERIALAVSFDYGSKHNARELPLAQLHCQRLGIEHLMIPLSFMDEYFSSSLLKGGTDIPETDENIMLIGAAMILVILSLSAIAYIMLRQRRYLTAKN